MPAGCKRGERRGDCSVAGRNHRVSFIRRAGRRFSLAATMILHSHSFFAIRRARLPWTPEPGSGVVRLDGIEPTTPAWKAGAVLPRFSYENEGHSTFCWGPIWVKSKSFGSRPKN